MIYFVVFAVFTLLPVCVAVGFRVQPGVEREVLNVWLDKVPAGMFTVLLGGHFVSDLEQR